MLTAGDLRKMGLGVRLPHMKNPFRPSNALPVAIRIALVLAVTTAFSFVVPNRVVDRIVPPAQAAAFTWTGAVSADWFDPGNWSPAGVPGANDVATVNSGTVDIPTDATVAALTFGGGTIQGAGTLTVTGTLDWTAGRMGGTGATVISPGAKVTVSGTGFKTVTDNRRFDNAGAIVIVGAATLGVGGTGSPSPSNPTVNNGGLIDFQGDGAVGFGSGTLSNTGIVRKSGGLGAAVIKAATFNNDGSVEAQAGTFQVGRDFATGAGTSAGAFTVAGGATLQFSSLGVTHTLTDTSSVSGAGNVTFAAGRMEIHGGYNVQGTTSISGSSTIANFNSDAVTPSLSLTGGILGGAAKLTVAGASSWTAGRMTGSGATVISPGATLNVSGASSKGLDGRRLDNNGTINIAGTPPPFAFFGTTFTLNNTGLINFGDGGNFTLSGSGGTINNTGTLRKSAGVDVSLITHTLNNNGAVEVQTGTLQLGRDFATGGGTSAGAFTIAAGATLQFASLGVPHTLTSTSSVSGAGNVVFVNGPTNIGGAYTLSGTSIIGASSGVAGTVNVNNDVSITTLHIAEGAFNTLGGGGSVTVTGALNWLGGRMNGTGTTLIAEGATATVSGSSAGRKELSDSRRFVNNGTLAVQHGASFSVSQSSTAVITNNGLFDAQGDNEIGSDNGQSATFVNNGTLRKSGGGVSRVTRILQFHNRGTIDIPAGTLRFDLGFTQTAGATTLNGGTLSFSSPFSPGGLGTFVINGGALVGAGTVEGNVVNGSTVSPGLAPNAPATLRITGNYTQTASGFLDIEIGGTAPGTQFDQLILGTDSPTKGATLGGTLDVRLINNFQPAINDSFEIIRYSTLLSKFVTITGLDIGSEQEFAADYRSNNLVLISSDDGGTPPTGCGGPARLWVHMIAPRTVRVDNRRPGSTLYKGIALYGNSGGTGAFALVTARFKNLRTDHVVRAEGISKAPLVPVTDPAVLQIFESLPIVVTDPETGDRSVHVLVYVPPDNRECHDAGQVVPPGSFPIFIEVGVDGGDSSSDGCGDVDDGGSLLCDPDFISENDLRATQVDVSRISACMPAIGDLLRGLVPGAANDIFEAVETGGDPAAMASFAASTAAAALVPGAGLVDVAGDALAAADACQLGPDGFARNETTFVFSCDPNDKVGSSGVGAAQFISGEVPIAYAVFFENKPEASAPAQDVVITDQLDVSKFDLSTFQLGPISFGNKTVSPPAGVSEFNPVVDLRPDNDLLVRINAKLDETTGLLTWRFTSIDPDTLQPTADPLAGFLPPNHVPSEGEGSVLFTVSAKQGLASGAQIHNQARIFFDTNDPIDTPVWTNTIDNAKPASQVQPLPSIVNSESFAVQWSGADADSGISNFSIFVSEDGGPFQLWLHNTIETSAVFKGQQGKTYGFFSMARDLTGNVEKEKTVAEATTIINTDQSSPVTTATLSQSPNAAGWHNADVTVSLNATDLGSGVKEISYAVKIGAHLGGETVSGGFVSIPLTAEGVNQIQFFARDVIGNTEATQTIVINLDKSAPILGCPPDVTTSTDLGLATAVVHYMVTARDGSGEVALTSTPPSGAVFALGSTPVTATGTDPAGNSASCSFRVTVIDTEPPAIADQPDRVAIATSAAGANVTFDKPAATDNSGQVQVACTPGSGSLFAIGRSSVVCTATDGAGNRAHSEFTVDVVYGICTQYDSEKPKQAGSTIPLKLELCAADTSNLSSSSIVLHAVSLTHVSTNVTGEPEAPGNSQPDNDFRFTSPGYQFNLQTTGLAAGSWTLDFTVSGSPTIYHVPFMIK